MLNKYSTSEFVKTMKIYGRKVTLRGKFSGKYSKYMLGLLHNRLPFRIV